MSDAIAGLIVSLCAGLVLVIVAILIRVRGPVGLIKGVDWTRVSDPDALGQFVSLIMLAMGALTMAHGGVLYALSNNHASRNLYSVTFVVLMSALGLALVVGQQRFQDRPPRHGR